MKKIQENTTSSKVHYLQALIDHLRTNPNKFALSIGLPRAEKIYNILRFRNGISTEMATMISSKYPVSYNWLLTGEGEMLADSISEKITSNAKPLGNETGTYTRNGNEFIELTSGLYRLKTKLVMHKAHAGYLTGWGDEEFVEELPEHEIVVSKPVAGQYMSFETCGDSMDDGTKESIENGSIVTGRKIERKYWTSKLHLKKFRDFVIVCNNTEKGKGGILVKRIIEHNTTENYIICHSLNQDKDKYPDFRIDMIDIMQIFNIVQVTRKY